MRVTSATVGFPVTDLEASRSFYSQVFGLGEPDRETVEDVLEWDLGPVWLQIFPADPRGASQLAVRFGVDDVVAEHQRLVDAGLAVEDIVRVEGTLEFFDFRDPDGHLITVYTVR